MTLNDYIKSLESPSNSASQTYNTLKRGAWEFPTVFKEPLPSIIGASDRLPGKELLEDADGMFSIYSLYDNLLKNIDKRTLLSNPNALLILDNEKGRGLRILKKSDLKDIVEKTIKNINLSINHYEKARNILKTIEPRDKRAEFKETIKSLTHVKFLLINKKIAKTHNFYTLELYNTEVLEILNTIID